MKANELRIGNYIFDNEIVGSITKTCIWNENENIILFDEIEPIHLTEEWLIKFGFLKQEYRYLTKYYFYLNLLSHGEISFHNTEKGFKIDLGTTTGYHVGTTNIKYVHQLQNLYFALTGEELTIKN